MERSETEAASTKETNIAAKVPDLLVIEAPTSRRLVALRVENDRLVAEYDPADLDEAAQVFWAELASQVTAAQAAEVDDTRTAAQMYAATVDDQIRIIGDLRAEVEHWKAGHADMAAMHAEAVASLAAVSENHAGWRNVVEAGRALAKVEQTRNSQTEHSSAWLYGQRAAVRQVVDAVAALPAEATDG